MDTFAHVEADSGSGSSCESPRSQRERLACGVRWGAVLRALLIETARNLWIGGRTAPVRLGAGSAVSGWGVPRLSTATFPEPTVRPLPT